MNIVFFKRDPSVILYYMIYMIYTYYYIILIWHNNEWGFVVSFASFVYVFLQLTTWLPVLSNFTQQYTTTNEEHGCWSYNGIALQRIPSPIYVISSCGDMWKERDRVEERVNAPSLLLSSEPNTLFLRCDDFSLRGSDAFVSPTNVSKTSIVAACDRITRSFLVLCEKNFSNPKPPERIQINPCFFTRSPTARLRPPKCMPPRSVCSGSVRWTFFAQPYYS